MRTGPHGPQRLTYPGIAAERDICLVFIQRFNRNVKHEWLVQHLSESIEHA
jgi:hypothetical protein